MSAAPTLCQNPCETCAKDGLPLLLTRYALMPTEINAPKLTGNLDAADLKKVPLGSGAHYGLRLLRSGYVYVFDEKRKLWDEYFVTADGFLSKMPPRIRALKAQPKPATEFSCARNGAAPLAGVITIRNAKHAGNVWIAFSDVEWTDQVFLDHIKSEEHRKKHMKCVVVSGGKVAAQADTAPLAQMEQVVPEFRQGMGDKQFTNWCPHRYNARQGSAPALLKAADKIRPGGGAAIVALHDPVGLAIEIASLMEVRKVTFINQENVAKPRFAASTIASLEASIKDQVKLAEIAAGEKLAQRAEAGPSAYNPNPALWGMPGDMEEAARWRAHTPQSLQKVADNKWRAYTHDRTGKPRFDAAGSQAWLKSYNEGFKKFDGEQIAPLAQAHVAWMKHRCMVSHLSCNYDCADLGSGVAFTAAVANMLRHTADKQPSYDLYVQWLKEGDTSAASNLLMRALGFNQDKLLKEIQKADKPPLDGRAFPSDMLVDFVKDGLEKLPPGGHVAMADLLQSAGGALFKNMDELLKGGPGARAIAAIAAVSGVQFTPIEVPGKRDKFVQHMMKALMQLDPNMKVSHNEMGKAIAAQLRLMEIEGLPMNKSDKRRWLVVLDKSAGRTATTKGLVGDALARELAKSMRQVDKLPGLKAEVFKAGVAGKAFDAGGNVVIGLVQAYNFTKLASDYTGAMSHDKTEAGNRLIVGALAIMGSFGEATGLTLQAMHEAGKLRNAAGLRALRVADVLKVGGKRLGLGAGLLVAGMDVMKVIDAEKQGDRGLAIAYGFSAFLGGSLAIAFFVSGSIPLIGWLIVGLAVVALLLVTLYIETHKDNPLQEWLMRCHFSSRADKYSTHAEEAAQFKRALA